jgi:hypothetical protein
MRQSAASARAGALSSWAVLDAFATLGGSWLVIARGGESRCHVSKFSTPALALILFHHLHIIPTFGEAELAN